MRVVVPGKADPAVDLNTFPRCMHVSIRRGGLGDAGQDGQFRIVLCRGVGRTVGSGFGQFDFQQHIRALVLDRLKRAYSPTELGAQLGVLDRGLQQPLRAADHFVRQGNGGQVEDPLDRPRAVDVGAESGDRRMIEIYPCQFAGRVKGGERAPNDPRTVRRRHMEGQLVLRLARDNDEQVGNMAVDNEALATGQLAVADRRCDAIGVPAAARLRHRQCRKAFARRDRRQEFFFLRCRPGFQDRGRAQNRGGKERRAKK